MNGYNSSSHSPPGALMGVGSSMKSPNSPMHSPGGGRGAMFLSDNSAAASEDEDNIGDRGPPSPTGPLSLTANDRETKPASPKLRTSTPVQVMKYKQYCISFLLFNGFIKYIL